MKFSFHTKNIFLISLFIQLLLITGCGVWENFTTYFNLYYNASDLFDQAEKKIKEQKNDLFSTETPNLPGTVNTDLQKVIEKCSAILQFNSESAYVENALLMLGKAFYYQKNYLKSLRKFKEFEESYPESDNFLEAQLWIAKCEMRLKNFDEGMTSLTSVISEAVKRGNEEIISNAYIEEIVYKITIEDYEGAIASANAFMEDSDNDEIKAQVWFELGKLNTKIGDVENAIIAYENVLNYSLDFNLEFEAKLNYGISLREGGRNEEALVVFDDMRSEDKYSADFDKIDFQIAMTNHALGKIEEAIDLFNEIDVLYKNTSTAAAAKYELAKIFENDYLKLDSAAVYYKRATMSSLPKEYLEPAREKERLFSRYLVLIGDISVFRKQLFYSQNPDEFVKDSIAYVEDSLAIAEEISKVTELQAIWAGLDSLINKPDTSGFFADTLRALDLFIAKDTTLIKDTLLAKLHNPQQNNNSFITSFDSLFNSELFLRTRRSYTQKLFLNQNRQKQLANQLPDSLKFKNNPPVRPTITVDSLHTILVKNELELGNLFLTELNIPDSAKFYYTNILETYPGTKYEANTLYALGSYYLTINDKNRADSLFNIIYTDYRDQSIVNAAADKLGKELIDLNYDSAESEYESAEQIMLNEDYNDAIEKFYNIYELYPNSPIAAKALYTTGWILENELSLPDSAASVYDTLSANYPSSIYVQTIAGKLSIYKQEQKKLLQAREDSLKLISIAYTDSLGSDSLSTSFTNESEPTTDTNKVALRDENLLKTNEIPNKKELNKLPKVKEPLWNPRKRK